MTWWQMLCICDTLNFGRNLVLFILETDSFATCTNGRKENTICQNEVMDSSKVQKSCGKIFVMMCPLTNLYITISLC